MSNRISIVIPIAVLAASALVVSPAHADSLTQALAEAMRSHSEADDSDTHLLRLDSPQIPPPDTQKKPDKTLPPADAPPPGEIRLRRFKRLQWSPEGNFIRTQGDFEVAYTHVSDKSVTTLFAHDLDYNIETGLVKASGGILLSRAEGSFAGDTIEFNLEEDTGFVTMAEVNTDFFTLKGKRIEALPKNTYVVTDGEFTTCTRERPDYKIQAKHITVVGTNSVSAKNITLYLGPTRLISLPSLRRSLRQSSGVAVPRPAYSRSEGLTVRYTDRLLSESYRILDFDGRLGFKYPFVGFANYQQDLSRTNKGGLPPLSRVADLTNPLHGVLEQLSPPTFEEYAGGRYPVEPTPRITFFGALQSRQSIFNRNRYDLLLSRYPEVGVSFANILGHNPKEGLAGSGTAENTPTNLSSSQIVRHHVPNAPFLLDATVSAGHIFESPTRAQGFRLASRINVTSQPLLIGRRLSLRVAASNFFNIYGAGTVYNLFAPEVDLNLIPTRSTLFGIGYRFETDMGQTPFAFDRQDLRQELRLHFQTTGTWTLGIQTSYNLQRFTSYETQIAVLRNLDCLQYGIAYRFRSQQFNLVFNFLPASPNRSRVRHELLPVP